MVKFFRNLLSKWKAKIRKHTVIDLDIHLTEEDLKDINEQMEGPYIKGRKVKRKKGKDRIVHPPRHKPIKKKPH